MTRPVSPVSSQSPELVRYLTENVDEMARHHACRSKVYGVAMVISGIAALTIFGGMTAMYLGLLSTTSLSGEAALCIIAASCASTFSIDYFAKRQIDESHQMKWHQKVGQRLEKIKDWDDSQITEYFQQRGKAPHEDIPPILRQIDAERPLRALLPFVARCQLIEHYVSKWGLRHTAHTDVLRNLDQRPAEVRENLRKIYEPLETRSKAQKMNYDALYEHVLNLV